MGKQNVLVTGGAGFIGSHVAEHLLKAGYNVVILDDLSGGFIENVPLNAEFIKGSITNHELLSSLFTNHKFEYVFHLAAYAAEGLSHFIKRFNYTNNVIGSVNLINESIKHNIKCFVFTSSIAVYGTNQLPMREDMTPQPEDSYGIAKLCIEQELKASHAMFGLEYVIFRPHNVYGEGQNIGDKYRNVIGIFMNNILQGMPIHIFGDGKQTRAFTHIDDVAPIIAGSIKNRDCYGEIFNVGSDVYYSVNDMADIVMGTMGKNVDKYYVEARNEVINAYSDHSKLQKFFGRKNCVLFKSGIARMAEWVQKTGVRKSSKFENIEITKALPKIWKK